jgi:hypothetical protein
LYNHHPNNNNGDAMTTLPTAGNAVAAIAKRVRFSPFVTYCGDEAEPPPEMLEESLRMDGSHVSGGGNHLIGGRANRSNKRASLDMTELLSVDRQFGTLTVANGSDDVGFRLSSCELDFSKESITEGNEYDDDDDNDNDNDDDQDFKGGDFHQFGDLDFSSGHLSDCSFPPPTQIHAAAIETQPCGADRCPCEGGHVAVGTAAY